MSSAGLDFQPGRLWSLLDMLTVFARPYIFLGEEIQSIKAMFFFADSEKPDDPRKELTDQEKEEVKEHLKTVLEHCETLGLPICKELISARLDDPPKTGREFEILTDALYAEIRDKVLVFVPTHRRKFMLHKRFMSEAVRTSFPNAWKEMGEAGKSHAVGLHTAAVFHCARAIEIGLRAMATQLNVTFQFPLEQADQEQVIRSIESKITAMKDQKKGAEKDANLHFYSEAALEFRFFKDAWRVRVAHARATYDEPQALGVLEHSARFLGDLASRLKEPGV